MAFSLQLYTVFLFVAFAVVRTFDDGGFAAAPVWPVAYAMTAAVLAAGIARPFSRQYAAAGGAFIVVVALARIVAVAEVALHRGLPAPPEAVVLAALWGLVVVVGLRWPHIAWGSGVRHLTDVGAPEDAPPEPMYPASAGG